MSTDLMDILYSYARDHEIAALLSQHDGYNESVRCVHGYERRLRAVSAESAAVLDDLAEEQRLSQFFREEACFCAGFRIAVELTRG